MDTVTIGEFRLEAPDRIARGGMGEVWFARHQPTGLPSAIKLILRESEDDAEARRRLQDEIQLAARLDHPAVIRVYAAGEIDAAAVAATRGRLRRGTPWLAMEWASGGPVRIPAHVGLPWPEASAALEAALLALAHAHGRGVLHRDVKPSNMLRCNMSDLRPGWKLSDFGLATMLHCGMASGPGRALSPAYAAPELWRGELEAQGPWTDLYALGCTAWHLVMGSPPFREQEGRSLAAQHLEDALPRLLPADDVPAELGAWIAHLTRKQPERRPASAAEALAALRALEWPDPVRPARLGQPLFTGPEGTTASWAPPDAHPTVVPPSALPEAVAPPPLAPAPPVMRAVGHALLPLRVPPLVGREAQREGLWRALVRAVREGRPVAVGLRGPQGVGRGRLARWVSEAAAETLGAPVLRIDEVDPESLRSAVRAGLCLGTRTGRALERTLLASGTQEDLDGARALARWLDGDAAAEIAPALHAFLVRLAPPGAVRPIVLVLDGLGRGTHLEQLAQQALRGPALGPLLLVASLDPDEDARAISGQEILEIPPMSVGELTELVDGLMLLEPNARDQVVRWAQGLPFLAVQAVTDLAASGRLAPGPHGLVMGAEPPDASGLWSSRLEAARGRLGPDAALILAVLALAEAPERETRWAEAARRAGLAWSPAAPLALEAIGLVVRARTRWQPAHPSVRRSLGLPPSFERRVHAAWVEILGDDPGLLARRARHLAGLGREAEARLACREAVARAFAVSAYLEAMAALDIWAGCLDQDGIAAAEEERREVERGRMRAGFGRGAYDLVWEQTGRYLRDGRSTQGAAERGEVLRLRGLSEQRRAGGDRLAAEAYLLQAAQLARLAGDQRGEARCQVHLAAMLRDAGARSEALATLDAAERGFEAADDSQGLADVCVQRAELEVQLGRDLDAARRDAELALERFRALRNPYGVGRAWNVLGDVARRQGDLDAAESAYREAWSALCSVGSSESCTVQANLGLALLDRGHLDAAAVQLGAALREADRPGRAFLRPYLHAALLEHAVSTGAVDTASLHLEAYRDLQRIGGGAISSVELDARIDGVVRLIDCSENPAMRALGPAVATLRRGLRAG